MKNVIAFVSGKARYCLFVLFFAFLGIQTMNAQVVVIIDDGFSYKRLNASEAQNTHNEISVSLNTQKIALNSKIPLAETVKVEVVDEMGNLLYTSEWLPETQFEMPCNIRTNTAYYLRIYNVKATKTVAFKVIE